MTTKYIVNRAFKYDGKELQPGDEFVPIGGTWDHILTDPEKKYVRIVEVKEKPEKKRKVKPKAKAKKKYKCDHCKRTFDTPQGKAAHSRVHKKRSKK